MSEITEHDTPTAPAADVGDRSLPPRFYTYAELAKAFGRSPRTVRWWIKSGRLKAVRIGQARFIAEAEILRLREGGKG